MMVRRFLGVVVCVCWGVVLCGRVCVGSSGGVLLRLTDDERVCVGELLGVGGDVEEVCLTDSDRYDAVSGVGFDVLSSSSRSNGSPYYVSVAAEDGNYLVSVLLGDFEEEGRTTVRAESRRVFADDVCTLRGEFRVVRFVVNKRSVFIDGDSEVLIKERERLKLNWDDRLTIEINGERPACAGILIERDTSALTVFLAGNSTVVDQDEEPWASWGQMITRFFTSDVSVANYAESGESAESFMRALRLEKALTEMRAGDYMFIEFGHNDQKLKGAGCGAFYSFSTNLKIMIDRVRERGGIPVLVTPTRRRFFRGDEVVDTHEDYPEAVRVVASREGVALVDLQESTKVLYEALGCEESKRAFVHYPSGTYVGQTKDLADNTHFNAFGAYEVARLVVECVRECVPALAVYLRPDCGSFDPAVPDDPDVFHWVESPFADVRKPDGN